MLRWTGLSRITLRELILMLAVGSVVLMLLNGLYASIKIQRQMLIGSTLETNRVYARKLAETTDNYFVSIQHALAYSADYLGQHWDNSGYFDEEAKRLLQFNSFNSVLMVDSAGKVLSAWPARVRFLMGSILLGEISAGQLSTRISTISPQYRAITGRLVVIVSQPIYDGERYLGMVAGVIYLQEENILQTLLSQHYYEDGTDLYVVDREQQLIYHPERRLIGKKYAHSAIVQAARSGQVGSIQAPNSSGDEMLAGYASSKQSGWSIVVQRPLSITVQALSESLMQTALYMLPFFLLALLAVGWMSHLIARPLGQLARHTRQLDSADAAASIESVHSWYFEAAQLKASILAGLALLNRKITGLSRQSMTDALTGLLNRRALQACLDRWQLERRAFSVIMLDVDHFKQVNDSYGHAVGDQVLCVLADVIRQNFGINDVLCRSGGEEFTLLLPNTGLAAAQKLAEQLCRQAAQASYPLAQGVTISLGVTYCAAVGNEQSLILAQADAALYRAKAGGRNRVELA